MLLALKRLRSISDEERATTRRLRALDPAQFPGSPALN
jgi:hypothetical protein